jgi:outer membrane lipoprotein-sorting protein
MKKTIIFFLILWIPLSVQAYVMPGKQMIEKMAQHLGSTQSLSAVHSFTLMNQQIDGAPLTLEESIIYKFPNAMHSEILMKDKQKLHVCSSKGAVTIIDGIVSEEPYTSFDLYKYLLLERDKNAIARRLKVSGVNIQVSSYGKFEKKAVYVIGANFPDMSVPQIWLEINTFMPFRWIITPNTYGQSLEILYKDWKQISKDVWYPKHISYIQNNTLLVEIQLKSLKIDPEVTHDLFDVSYFRQMYPSATVYDSPYETDMDEVQRTIRNFQRTFE